MFSYCETYCDDILLKAEELSYVDKVQFPPACRNTLKASLGLNQDPLPRAIFYRYFLTSSSKISGVP